MRIQAMCALTLCCALCFSGCSDDPAVNNASPTQPLSVLGHVPEQGAQQVALDQILQLNFSHAVDVDVLAGEGPASISPPLDGGWSWDDQGKVANFAPSVRWQPTTSYTITVPRGLKGGQRVLAADVTISFSTKGIDPNASTSTYTHDGQTMRVQRAAQGNGRSTYTMTTTAQLRDNDPASGQIVITEGAEQALVRSGHDVFDALFAMAWEETRQNSVESISDGAFNQGQGVGCSCFETGAKWNYVWTRDTAYAVDLGLGWVDPERAMRSLEFKLSELKAGGGAQIVQDTGSGGSYPVSTDRVVWAIGARTILNHLEPQAREPFARKTYEALVNTLEQDRALVFDPQDGLYRGEQSFLDWREQSYAARTQADVAELGMSKALSTNVGHYAAMALARDLAQEQGKSQESQKWGQWATALAQSIQDELWLDDQRQFSTFKLHGQAVRKFDWLGTSLAVLQGVGGQHSADAVSSYPHTSVGPPVLWPQQPLIPIYHNRGIWPFVTAYGVFAAAQTGNSEVFEHGMESLIRGAALNLSNMENFEFQTQKPWVDDGAFSGPVVNSRRQLWSVAGYLGAVIQGVFGVRAHPQGVSFSPMITATLRQRYFPGKSIALQGLVYRGRVLNVTVEFPTQDSQDGMFEVESMQLNNSDVTPGAIVAFEDLVQSNDVVIRLKSKATTSSMTLVEGDDFSLYWSPKDAVITSLDATSGAPRIEFNAQGEQGVAFNVYRNGVLVAQDVEAQDWTDPMPLGVGSAACYSVEAFFTSSKNHGHPSAPSCTFDAATDTVLTAFDWYVPQGQAQWSRMHGQAHFQDFGEPEDVLEVVGLRPKASGVFDVSALYSNGAGAISTGITAAVKWVEFTSLDDPTDTQRVPLTMPHLADWSRWERSTQRRVELDADKVYRMRISDGINMSYFAHFIPYTGGLGGAELPYNQVNIQQVDLRLVQGEPRPITPGIALDGQGDLGKFAPEAVQTPGALGAPWERVGMSWDSAFLYGAFVSESFEDPYAPVIIYLEAQSTSATQAVPSTGMAYSNLVPELAFSPTHAITLRRLSEDGTGAPYNGLWRNDAGVWVQVRRFDDAHWFASLDNHTLSYRLPRAWLPHATARVRVTSHVVHAQPGANWRDVYPAGATPWAAASEGFVELDLTQAP